MAKIFFSYSHDDEPYRDQLEKHLSSLQHEGLVESWHDRRLLAGADLSSEIDKQIDLADVILLLVSSSFLASRYCYSIEMTRALRRHASGEARVIPVIVRDCDWKSTPLGQLVAVPKDGLPITSWPNYDQAYTDVAKSLRQAIEHRNAKQVSVKSTRIAPGRPDFASQEITSTNARSSNLRIKKTFSDLDVDRFLQESFEFMSRYFSASLSELEQRNEGIQGQFRNVDSNTFTAAIYQFGKRKSECAVHVGSDRSRHNSITYSADAASRGNSYNESVSVMHDDQSMYLQPMGMASYDASRQLTQEGAAELFWGLLIRPLQ